MNNSRYTGRFRVPKAAPAAKKAPRRSRMMAMVMAVVLLLVAAVNGTMAWLTAETGPVQNTFAPATVSCTVTENFDKTTGVKTDVNVQNTSDIPAFLRVKLVTYRTNAQGQHIGGTAKIPEFTLGAGWEKCGDYYYYTKPVAPGGKPAAALAAEMQLEKHYTDADGGMQAVDVMAEAIQSVPKAAVQDAWGDGFSIDENGNLVVPSASAN